MLYTAIQALGQFEVDWDKDRITSSLVLNHGKNHIESVFEPNVIAKPATTWNQLAALWKINIFKIYSYCLYSMWLLGELICSCSSIFPLDHLHCMGSTEMSWQQPTYWLHQRLSTLKVCFNPITIIVFWPLTDFETEGKWAHCKICNVVNEDWHKLANLIRHEKMASHALAPNKAIKQAQVHKHSTPITGVRTWHAFVPRGALVVGRVRWWWDKDSWGVLWRCEPEYAGA